MPRTKHYRCIKCGREQDRHCNCKFCANQKCHGRLVEIGTDDSKCPTCGRPWKPEHVRICANCKKVIGSGHKFQYVQRKCLTTLIHRNCDDPQNYHAAT